MLSFALAVTCPAWLARWRLHFHMCYIQLIYKCIVQSDSDKPETVHARSQTGPAIIVDDDERDDGDYDARQALRFRRGLLDPRAADFRRSLLNPKVQSTWNVRCRVVGGGGEFFFPLEPSNVVRRPVYRCFLNLRKNRRSSWSQVIFR